MANTNAPFGFRQIKGTGSVPTYEQSTRVIDKDNTTAIFYGDAVIPLTTGYIAQATASTVRMEGRSSCRSPRAYRLSTSETRPSKVV